ncbi:DUF3006 family protein [Natrialbaceae archaeon GCM10025810]|uniref:DUF3006 family protein n=1 Tax=Halovalidus salilacus TaxID=3075124 RepID=UPI0036070A72
MTDTYRAVLDRIVDGETAVFLLEEDGGRNGNREVVDERAVDAERLPADGRREGAVYDVDVDPDDGSVLEVRFLDEATRDRRERTRDRFDRLSERLSDE